VRNIINTCLQVENEATMIKAKATGDLHNIHRKKEAKTDLFNWQAPMDIKPLPPLPKKPQTAASRPPAAAQTRIMRDITAHAD
jgi:hypothetical protein